MNKLPAPAAWLMNFVTGAVVMIWVGGYVVSWLKPNYEPPKDVNWMMLIIVTAIHGGLRLKRVLDALSREERDHDHGAR